MHLTGNMFNFLDLVWFGDSIYVMLNRSSKPSKPSQNLSLPLELGSVGVKLGIHADGYVYTTHASQSKSGES
jgi:hypothetical protein